MHRGKPPASAIASTRTTTNSAGMSIASMSTFSPAFTRVEWWIRTSRPDPQTESSTSRTGATDSIGWASVAALTKSLPLVRSRMANVLAAVSTSTRSRSFSIAGIISAWIVAVAAEKTVADIRSVLTEASMVCLSSPRCCERKMRIPQRECDPLLHCVPTGLYETRYDHRDGISFGKPTITA